MHADELSKQALRDTGRTVSVTVPAEIAFDIDRFQKVQRDILGRLGCMACCSGWDIRFELERRFVVDANMEVFGENVRR